MDNLSQFHNLLNLNGFTPGNQTKDFAGVLSNVDYFMRRLPDGTYQYVTLVNYLGEFREGILEVYPSEKNTRDKQQVGKKSLFRELEKLKEIIEIK